MRGPITATLALLVCGLAPAVERLPGLPPLEEILIDLRSPETSTRGVAQDWLYLLPLDELERVQADFDAKGGQRDAGSILHEILLARGHTDTVAAAADRVLAQGGTPPSWMRLPPRQLAAVAEAVVARMSKLRGAPEARVSHWIELAVASGHPKLLGLAVQRVMVGERMPRLSIAAELIAPIAAKLVQPREVDACIRLLGCIRPGWSEDPPRALTALARHPEIRVREGLARSLPGSSSSEALDLARRLLEDESASVRVAAFAALAQARDPATTRWLGDLAADARRPVDLRVSAWRSLTNRQIPDQADAARRVVLDQRAEAMLRLSALDYLIATGTAADLLDHLDRFDEVQRRRLLTALAEQPTPEILGRIRRQIDRIEDAWTREAVLTALAASSAPEALLVVIDLLTDRNAELRQAAGQALRRGTRRDGPAESLPGKDERRRRNDSESKLVAATWRAWFDRYRSPLDPQQEAELEAARESLLAREQDLRSQALASWTLLRLCGEPKLRAAALQRLAADPDPSVTTLLLDLIEDPEFADDRRSLLDPLRSRPQTDQALASLRTLLDDPDPSVIELGLRTLIAWRSDRDAGEVARLVLEEGVGFHQVHRELADWNHPAIQRLVRDLVAAEEPERAAARSRAMDLLLLSAGDAEVGDLSRIIERDPATAARPAGLLAALTLRGSASAEQAVLRLLESRQEVLRQLMLEALLTADLTQTEDQPTEAGPALSAALRAFAINNRQPDALRRQACILLGRFGHSSAMESFVAGLDELGSEGIAEKLLSSRRAATLPFLLDLYRRAAFDAGQATRLWRWLVQVGGQSELETKRQAEDYARILQERLELSFGQPVAGLVVSLEPVTGNWKANAELRVRVKIQNVSRQALSVVPHGSATVKLASTQHSSQVPIDLSGATRRPVENGGISLRGGASLQLELGWRMPTRFHLSLIDDQIRSELRLHLQTNQGSQQIEIPSAWQQLSLLPELWHAIDRRHQQ